MNEYLIGDTIKVTWVSSGTTPSAINYAVYDKDETLVASESMVSSGDGHYYGLYTVPDSGSQYYVMETLATVSGNPYKQRKAFRAVLGEVD